MNSERLRAVVKQNIVLNGTTGRQYWRVRMHKVVTRNLSGRFCHYPGYEPSQCRQHQKITNYERAEITTRIQGHAN